MTEKMSVIRNRERKAEMKKNARERKVKMVRVLHHKGHSNVSIAKELELSESTVRNMLKETRD